MIVFETGGYSRESRRVLSHAPEHGIDLPLETEATRLLMRSAALSLIPPIDPVLVG